MQPASHDAAARNRRAERIADAPGGPERVWEAATSAAGIAALFGAADPCPAVAGHLAEMDDLPADATGWALEMLPDGGARVSLRRGEGAPHVPICRIVAAVLRTLGTGGELSALTLVVEAAKLGEPVPEDVDAQGRPRDTAIVPGGLFPNAPRVGFVSVRDRSADDALLALPGHVREPELPLFPHGGDMAGAPLLTLADAAGIGGLQPGRGARIDKRILIYSLLSMPRNRRHPGGRHDHNRPLRWWTDRLYPARPYRASESAGRLAVGLRALVDATVRLADGRLWLPVTPRAYPSLFDPDAPVELRIELPPDARHDHGAAVPWQPLLTAGSQSDPAFDLVLGLAFLWDTAKAANGGHRIYATRPKARRNHAGALVDASGNVITARAGPPRKTAAGKLVWPAGDVPVSDWRHPAAVIEGTERHPNADRVPALTREGRRRLVYPASRAGSKTARSMERKRADEKIEAHAAAGRVVIERLPDGSWRILETPPWRSNPVNLAVEPCEPGGRTL